MIELHIASLWIGGIIGFILGTSISFFAAYTTEVQINSKRNDRFSDGWDAGERYQKAIEDARRAKNDGEGSD